MKADVRRNPEFALRMAASAALIMMIAGCARSAAFRRDSDFDEGAAGSRYYETGEKEKPSPTKRLAQLGQPRKRVVIYDFWNDTPSGQRDLGRFAADELRRNLYLSKRVVVPTDLKTEARTEDFLTGEKVRMAQLMRESRRLGVPVVAIGRIARIVFRQRGDDVGLLRQKQSLVAVDVEVKIFDVQNGREVFGSSRSGEASANSLVAFEAENLEKPEFRDELVRLALRDAMLGVSGDVLKTVEKLTWEGRIAKVMGSRIYINAGRASGLIGGDILKVLTPGEDVYDPGTGAFLGRAPGQVKGTLELVDFIGTDGAVAEIHTGANFQTGDLVQLY